jgi:hypothetical protein
MMAAMKALRLLIFVGLFGLGAAAPVPTPQPQQRVTIRPTATAPAPVPTTQQLNDSFGLPLWIDAPLWSEDGAAVAQRLHGKPESAAANQASYLVRRPPLILGAQPETLRVSSRNNKTSAILIMFANKGDSVGMKPFRDHFTKAADYNAALLKYEKDLAALNHRLTTDASMVEAQLTRALGAPERFSLSDSGPTTDIVKLWRWKEHAILFSVAPRESVSVRIVPPDQLRARAQHVSDADLKKEFQSRVQRRPNGDVVISGIPMVAQGRKGYCVPATWARYLQYAGITVDEYALADAGNTRAGSGTTTHSMVGAVAPIVARNKRRLISFKGAFTLSSISKHIDDGLPIMWTLCCVGPFRETGQPANRMGEMTPEKWSNVLKLARTNAHKLPRTNTDLHMCMIIGYNKTTKEVATSDSWGPGHEEKWYTVEEAQAVSRDEYYVISW